ncbi:acetylcholine receptor subunit alpha-L1-like [Tubulanus polymorphus]|uniref:acetylcholine receptor subunit alpha-L1-like n=1 Tax=Tubulanus polymorphus TaxID=672921 RepID=UPI003DA5ED7E
MKSIAVIFCIVTVVAAKLRYTNLNGAEKLTQEIRSFYKRSGTFSLPVANVSSRQVVKIGLALIKVLDVDTKKNILKSQAWIRFQWSDVHLKWDPAEYGGVEVVRIPNKFIWTPDIAVYNKANNDPIGDVETMAVVDYTGSVLLIKPTHLSTQIYVDRQKQPVTIYAPIKLASWTYDGFELDLNFFDNKKEIDLTDYIQNNEYKIIDHSARKNVKYYPCCVESYPDLTFNLTLSRYSTWLTCFVAIAPVITVSLLVPFVFLINPENPSKITLAIGVLITLVVLLTNSQNNYIAGSSTYSSLFILFYGVFGIIAASISLILTCILGLFYQCNCNSKPPACVQKVLSCIGYLLCVRPSADQPDQDEKRQTGPDAGCCAVSNYSSISWKDVIIFIDRSFFVVFLILFIAIAIITN